MSRDRRTREFPLSRPWACGPAAGLPYEGGGGNSLPPGGGGLGRGGVLVPLLLLVAACAGPGQATGSAAQPAEATSDRALVMAIRYEPTDLAQKIGTQSGGDVLKRPFNASLALIDGKGDPQPFLAQTLPQLSTDTWKVFPDGRMETIHQLRSGLTWQDGQPLTANDFVFGWKVYRTPGLGVFSPVPQDKMDDVSAPDQQTVLIQWNTPYPDASALTEARDGSLEPLPRHLLEQPFTDLVQDPSAKDRFLNLPFWTSEYVGAGAYRLDRWEPGLELVGVASDQYVLGRPRISRLIMRIIQDENTALSNVLAGSIDIATRFTLRFEQGIVLKRDWAAQGKGIVIMSEGTMPPISAIFQFRLEYQKTPELLDLRVRKALLYAVDKKAVLDGLYGGEGIAPDTFVTRDQPFYADLDRIITKYPYVPRQAEQLLGEAGLTRGADGFLVTRAGQRFAPDHRTSANQLTAQSNTIIDAQWRQLGIDVQPSVLPAGQDRDLLTRHTFPGIDTVGTSAADLFSSTEIGTPEKRWSGQNRGGYSNPEYDRLWDAYNTTLDRNERDDWMIRLAKLASEEVPALFVYSMNAPTFAYISALHGPDVGVSTTTYFFNIHQWELRKK